MKNHKPTTSLYRDVRGGFVAHGTSLAAWCRAHGVSRTYAARVLTFQTNGPAAVTLRRRLIRAAGLRDAA